MPVRGRSEVEAAIIVLLGALCAGVRVVVLNGRSGVFWVGIETCRRMCKRCWVRGEILVSWEGKGAGVW